MKRVITATLIVVGMLSLTGCEDATQVRHERVKDLMTVCIQAGGDFKHDNKGGGTPAITCKL